MESLASYGTDEEQENDYYSSTMDEGHNRVMLSSNSNQPRDDDTNYDDVTMDMSEDSNQSTPDVTSQPNSVTLQSRSMSSSYLRGGTSVPENRKSEGRKNMDNTEEKVEHYRKSSSGERTQFTEDFKSSRNRSDKDKYNDRHDTGKDRSERQERRDKDHRGHHRSDRDGDRDRSSRNDRERDKTERFDDRGRYERERNSSRRDDIRDYDRDRKRREDDRPKRSRRRSRSRSHSKSRSRSRERSIRTEKTTQKMQLLEKLGIELQTPEGLMSPQMLLQKSLQEQSQNKSAIELPKYYNPGVMNPMKYADQMQKRKLLWSKKSETKSDTGVAEKVVTAPSTSSTTNVNKWGSARFAQDTDGKVASKFMRLMGIKDPAPKEVEATGPSDIIKKQEEMFSTMEQQYEVARTVTHTMRGMGLGFGSHGRQF